MCIDICIYLYNILYKYYMYNKYNVYIYICMCVCAFSMKEMLWYILLHNIKDCIFIKHVKIQYKSSISRNMFLHKDESSSHRFCQHVLVNPLPP